LLKKMITAHFNAPLHIDDTTALLVLEFRDKCLQLLKENEIKVVLIDHLQMMFGGYTNGEEDMVHISCSLKEIASELGIIIIDLSQLERTVTLRPDKRPELFDLPDKSVARFANTVLFVEHLEDVIMYLFSRRKRIEEIEDKLHDALVERKNKLNQTFEWSKRILYRGGFD